MIENRKPPKVLIVDEPYFDNLSQYDEDDKDDLESPKEQYGRDRGQSFGGGGNNRAAASFGFNAGTFAELNLG